LIAISLYPCSATTRSRSARCASAGSAQRQASSTRHRFSPSPTWQRQSSSTRRPASRSAATKAATAFVTYGDESVFDLDVAEPSLDTAANKAGCYLITADADQWHQRLAGLGLPVTELEDKPWGMREFTLTDSSGNQIRVGRSVED